MIDTGANVSSVPLWAALQLGVVEDETGRRPSFGAGGGFDSYSIEVGIDARIGDRWLDLGAVKVVSPDTEWSRRKSSRLPFLLGGDGFFDKFNVCFDEPRRTMWLRRAGTGAEDGRP